MLQGLKHEAIESHWGNLCRTLEAELAENFLHILMYVMKLSFCLSAKYRANIEGFNGRYQFSSQDGGVDLSVVFANGRIKIEENIIPDPDVTVLFRDGRALMNFMLAPKQDIVGSMLRHDLQTRGNLNYIYKLGYLARKLQLMLPHL